MPGEKVILATEGENRLPDLTGWSLRDAMKLAVLLDLDLKTTGKGYVSEQNLEAGTVVKKGDMLHIRLQSFAERNALDKAEKEEIEEDG